MGARSGREGAAAPGRAASSARSRQTFSSAIQAARIASRGASVETLGGLRSLGPEHECRPAGHARAESEGDRDRVAEANESWVAVPARRPQAILEGGERGVRHGRQLGDLDVAEPRGQTDEIGEVGGERERSAESPVERHDLLAAGGQAGRSGGAVAVAEDVRQPRPSSTGAASRSFHKPSTRSRVSRPNAAASGERQAAPVSGFMKVAQKPPSASKLRRNPDVSHGSPGSGRPLRYAPALRPAARAARRKSSRPHGRELTATSSIHTCASSSPSITPYGSGARSGPGRLVGSSEP